VESDDQVEKYKDSEFINQRQDKNAFLSLANTYQCLSHTSKHEGQAPFSPSS
jgi:hypothetical protein